MPSQSVFFYLWILKYSGLRMLEYRTVTIMNWARRLQPDWRKHFSFIRLFIIGLKNNSQETPIRNKLLNHYDTAENKGKKKGARIRAYIALAIVVIALIVFAWRWYIQYTSYYSTDDAYIDADKVAVSSKILGRITTINADEGDSVWLANYWWVLTVVTYMPRNCRQKQPWTRLFFGGAGQSRYELDQKSELVQELTWQGPRKILTVLLPIWRKVISKEQFDHAQKTYESSKAMLDAAKPDGGK